MYKEFNITKEEETKILNSFDNHTWRTLGGISRDSGISKERALIILHSMDKNIIISNTRSINGDTLFAEKDRYWKNAGFWEKVRVSLIGYID